MLSYQTETMQPELLIHILTGQASAEEKEKFYLLLDSKPELEQDYLSLLKLWNFSEMGKNVPSESHKREMFEAFWKNVQSRSGGKTRKIVSPLFRYAAIIIFALLSGFVLNNLLRENPLPLVSHYQSSAGSLSTLTLEDGSYIWLNANTQLNISQEKNKVYARLEGEAYFNVRHNEQREFAVDIGKIRILDLGTEFNISSYAESGISRITLLQGDIDILGNSGMKIRSMDPGETFLYDNRTNTYSVERYDPTLITGWMDGKFVFIDRTLEEICEELEKWYGVDIIIEKQAAKDQRYTSIMKRTTTVRNVLELLKVTAKLEVEIEDKNEGKDIIRLK